MAKRDLLVCPSCLGEGFIEDYYLSKGGKKSTYCKPCAREYAKKLLEDPEKLARKKEREALAYQRNKDGIAKQKRHKINSSLPHRISVILQNCKSGAKKKGFEYCLDKGYAEELYLEQGGMCALSGERLELSGDRYLSNLMSLDRIDSSTGYVDGNVQWVCVKYNLMKAHATQEEFIEMCKKVVEKANA